ncbi:hypothetical protein [Thiomicrorhabdus aquaedulcis]|uniref:hypothetical protein n=1 Tax=Thiomicrorhabdus aquaedulcis TaxID=2211106 RepID=UPI000FDC27D8|nr:hypothetical protein [Thiomicrorhabdus aquaedulcis]
MKTVFYFNDIGIHAYSNHASLADKARFFAFDDNVPLEKYLALIPERSQTYLILDMVDEDIHFEWVPKVQPWEKKGILNRRKERFKHEDQVLSEVRWTSNARKNEEGRNEEMILLATVHQNQPLANFLASLEEAQVILTAVYSKAFLLAEFFKSKARPALNLARTDVQKPFLLIARQSSSTFRQLFF